jgi:hypothetical protein
MTPEQFTAIIERLDKIVLLLGMQTLGEEPQCEHEKAVDMGIYGDNPGAKMYCPECKETFSRIVEV